MEYAIVDKNGKFIGKTTNKLISQVPYPRYGILPMYLKMRLEFQTNNERILKCIKENILKHNIIITEIIVQASRIEQIKNIFKEDKFFSVTENSKEYRIEGELNFVINDSLNEEIINEIITKEIESVMAKRMETKTMVSVVFSGSRCNEKCWYCTQRQGNRSDNFAYLTDDEIFNEFKRIVGLLNDNNSLDLMGGEVSAYSLELQLKLKQIIENEVKKGREIIIHTNFKNKSAPILNIKKIGYVVHVIDWVDKKLEDIENISYIIVFTERDSIKDLYRFMEINSDIMNKKKLIFSLNNLYTNPCKEIHNLFFPYINDLHKETFCKVYRRIVCIESSFRQTKTKLCCNGIISEEPLERFKDSIEERIFGLKCPPNCNSREFNGR